MRRSGATLIEILCVTLALLCGAIAATYALTSWGIWGGVGGFLAGTLAFVGAMELIGRIFAPRQPRCLCGACGTYDYISEGIIDGQRVIVYACGRVYRIDKNGVQRLAGRDGDTGGAGQ